MKAYLYARCSTKEQGKSHLGIEAQIHDMQKFCALMDIEVVGVREEVVSGTYILDRRPVMKQTMEDAKKQKDCIVLVSRLDRIARKMEYILEAVDNNVKIVECGLSASRMEIQMRAMWAEDERLKISQRTSSALRAKRKRGDPLGFMISGEDCRQKAIDASVVVTVDEANKFALYMKEMIEPLVQSGKSLKGIAEYLNKYKIKTYRGKQWQATTVKNLIARWKYQ